MCWLACMQPAPWPETHCAFEARGRQNMHRTKIAGLWTSILTEDLEVAFFGNLSWLGVPKFQNS